VSFGARTYIGSVVALGTAILIRCVALDPHLPNTARFLQLLILAILASTFKIRLPRIEGTISLNFVVYLIGIGTLTLTETVLMASVATLVQAVWRAKKRPQALKVLFNVSTLAISVAGAHFASQQMRQNETPVPALVVAATVLFILNSWLVSLVVALTSGESAMRIWRNCNRWTFLYYVMGAGVSALVIAYGRVVGWEQALAMLPAAYLMFSYNDAFVAKTREADR
jgi:hypothetical protein